jgi:hypothetical protein
MRLQPGRWVADYVSGTTLLSGSAGSERDACATEDRLRWHDSMSEVANNPLIPAPAALWRAG